MEEYTAFDAFAFVGWIKKDQPISIAVYNPRMDAFFGIFVFMDKIFILL